MTLLTSPRKPSRLPVGFYVWLRKNHETIVRLRVAEGYSIRAIADELEWPNLGDGSRALKLLSTFEKEVAEGNWLPIEKELFGVYSYYEKLPSIQRAFYELRDKRASGKYLPGRVKKKTRVIKRKNGVGEPTFSTDPTTVAPISMPSPVPIKMPISAPPAPSTNFVSTPVFTPPPVTPPPAVSSAPVIASPSPAPTKSASSSGPRIIPKSEQIRQFDQSTGSSTKSSQTSF